MTKASAWILKANEVYYSIVYKIRDKIGDANILLLLEQYEDPDVAEKLINTYEDLTGEEFSGTNRVFLKAALIDVLGKLREDFTKEESDADISDLQPLIRGNSPGPGHNSCCRRLYWPIC